MRRPQFDGLVQPPVADGGAGTVVVHGTIETMIHDAIEGGSFLPFLGAGASASGPDSGLTRLELWDPARDRAAVLLKGDADVASYIRSLCSSRGLAVEGHAAASRQDLLEALLFALANLAVQLGRIFGKQLQETPSPLESSPTCRVEIPGPDRQAVTAHVLAGLDAARALRQGVVVARGDDTDWLDASGIYRSLQVLTATLVDVQHWPPRSMGTQLDDDRRLLRMRADVELLLREQGEMPGDYLHLGVLQWLAGAVWHVLRSEVPVYPTSDELSFRIGLGATVDCLLRRAPLIESASAYDHRSLLPERIASWLAAAEAETRREPTDLYLALAASLKVGFDRHIGHGRAGHVPVVFTTNYDRCLELALEEVGSAYHLICPAILPPPDEDDAHGDDASPVARVPVRPVWMTAKVAGDRKAHSAHNWQVLTASPDRKSAVCGQDGKEIQLAGPVVVKLHGSPLEELTEPYTNFIVLSEATYLETITGHLKPSEWIEHQLQRDGRDLWFIGYSIGDWDVRGTLYQQATTGGQAHYRGAVYRTVNSSQNALLSSMDVTPVCVRLTEIVDMIGSEDHVKRILDPVLRRLGR